VLQRQHVVYFVKRPDGKRRQFAIAKRITRPDGKKEYGSHQCPTLLSLNKAIKLGAIVPTEAELQIEQLCRALNDEAKKRARGAYVASEANLKLLEKYWKAEYTHRRCRKDTALARLQRAIDALGPTPLLAPRDEVQGIIDRYSKGDARLQRRLISPLNQIRKWYGIGERLALDHRELPKFRYVTAPEFEAIMNYVEGPYYAAFFRVLFYSGMRTGEAFAFPPNVHRDGTIRVMRQMLRTLEIRPTKSRKERSTLLLDDGREAMSIWLSAPKEQLRGSHFRAILRRAARKAFPSAESKWVSPHDLRHSFAVHMLTECGVSIDMIAKLLGNSVQVCQDYYLNFAPSDEVLLTLLVKTRHKNGAPKES
jgi:integrase